MKVLVHSLFEIKNTNGQPAIANNGNEAGYRTVGSMERITQDGGDVKFQIRKSGTSARSLLANDLESVAQNDIERNKLTQYCAPKIRGVKND